VYCLTKKTIMKNFILKNINTGVKEKLNYSELQNRIKKNRKDFFDTYRVYTITKKSTLENILIGLFAGVSFIGIGFIFLETITQIF